MVSLMMIRFAVEDGHSTIDLLDEKKANHLMRESHLAQGNLFLSHFVYLGSKAIRTTHNED